MKKAYDSLAAGRLVPYLQSAHREIRERAAKVRRLEDRLRILPEEERDTSQAHAELSIHRRELREARRDLVRLGCVVEDELGPFQVRIPGADGRLESGFSWTAGEQKVRPLEADTAA